MLKSLRDRLVFISLVACFQHRSDVRSLINLRKIEIEGNRTRSMLTEIWTKILKHFSLDLYIKSSYGSLEGLGVSGGVSCVIIVTSLFC